MARIIAAHAATAGTLAAAYYVVALLSLAVDTLDRITISPLWPAAGIALAVLLSCGKRHVFAVFAGSAAALLSVGIHPFVALVVSLTNAFEVWAAAWALERGGINGHSFYQPWDFLKYAAVTGASAALGSAVAVAALLSVAPGAEGGYAYLLTTRLLGHWTAMLIFAPAMLLWLQHRQLSPRWQHTLEAAALTAVTVAVCWGIFGGETWVSRGHYPATFMLLPMVFWPAVRMGLRETATLIVLITAFSLYGTIKLYGPFAALPRDPAVTLLQAFLVTLATTGMTLASAIWRVKDDSVELERRVEQRTSRLKQVNEELEAFCYTVAHDLRSPLRAMSGFSEAVLEDYADCLQPKGSEYLKRINGASRRMAGMIDEMLDLSLITRRESREETVDLSALARVAAEELRAGEPARDVEISIAPALVDHGDVALLLSALRHLLGNAWKFTRGRERARIEVGLLPQEPVPAYYVRDNGVGFGPDVAKLLALEPEKLTGEAFLRTGLGLAAVRRVVMRHGGRLWAQGESGRGATFYFTLHERRS